MNHNKKRMLQKSNLSQEISEYCMDKFTSNSIKTFNKTWQLQKRIYIMAAYIKNSVAGTALMWLAAG